jgi:hypothetical protein
VSDLPPDDRTQFDLRVEIERLERARADTQKLLTEVGKLNADVLRVGTDTRTLQAEQAKLLAEQVKLQRESRLAPLLAWIGVIGGLVTIAGALLHLFGLPV